MAKLPTAQGDQALAELLFTGSYTWDVPTFSKINDRLYSEKFEIGSYIWRLLLFPRRATQNQSGSPSMALYLDSPEAPYTPVQLSPCATFRISLINPINPEVVYFREASHTFTADATDWGFSPFIRLSDLQQSGLVADDTIRIRVDIRVQRDEGFSYDSRKATGFVGLKNQGATCYMNSLLQYLFHLPRFRKAVYQMPTIETEDIRKNMPLALQSLFFKLQYSQTSISTRGLTASFGWGSTDAFTQHDVQELNRVLCEKLEEKMKGTKVENVIKELFEGHTLNYISCINVEFRSERKESFMDLQLDVKGCKNLYDSFIKYTEEEVMAGDNQYKAEGHGLQDARKGTLFESLPPVLQLQLKRFEYDYQTDMMTKINDRYEFFEELDLDFDGGRIMSSGADRTVQNFYKLFAVLVHEGGVSGGHYYAFLKPDGENWCKFDDERVTKEITQRAVADNFGGVVLEEALSKSESSTATTQQPQKEQEQQKPSSMRSRAAANAYLLVYVRLTDWDNLTCPASKDDLEVHLRSRLEQEHEAREQRQRTKAEAHMFVNIKVATDEDIASQISAGVKVFDLMDHDQISAKRNVFRLRKHMRFTDFMQMVQERFHVPVEKQRLWVCARRPNGTYRVHRMLSSEEVAAQFTDLRDIRAQGPHVSKHAIMDIRLYLESAEVIDARWELGSRLAKSAAKEGPDSETLLIFFKAYYPEKEQLVYLGRAHLSRSHLIKDLLAKLPASMGLPEGTALDCFEETRKEPSCLVEPLEPTCSLGDRGFEAMSGDIFIVQRHVGAEEAAQMRHPTAADFLQYARSRRPVCFKRLEDMSEPGFVLELKQEDSYDQVALLLAKTLSLEPAAEGAQRIRFTAFSPYVQGPSRQPFSYRSPQKLSNMLVPPVAVSHLQPLQGRAALYDILYYEVLDLPLWQSETLKTLNISFHRENTELLRELTVRLPSNSTAADVMRELSGQLQRPEQEAPLRLMQSQSSKLLKVVPAEERVASLDDVHCRLRAEVVPEAELALPEGHRLLHCFHFQRRDGGGPGTEAAAQQPSEQAAQQALCCFGVPFLLRLAPGDSLAALQERIQAKLGASTEDVRRWKYWLWPARGELIELTPTDDVGSRLVGANISSNIEFPALGLEHEKTTKPRRPAPSGQRLPYDKPVKIFG